LATRFCRGQPQYRLLNTTRAYALGKLEEHGEVDLISVRHAEYVAEQLESERTNLSCAKERAWPPLG
jgi:predicted ATPase